MKKFVIDFFRKFPFCTGLLLLLIALHLAGVKDLRTPMVAIPENLFLIFAFYACAMLFFALLILPKTEQQKREKLTWSVVVSSVFVLTLVAKVFIS